MNVKANFIFLLMLAGLLCNCAIGPTSINVSHSVLPQPHVKRSGALVVREFRDLRTDCEPTQVGNKRNGFGMVLGSFHTEQRKTVASIVTNHFVDALRQAGYSVTLLGHEASNPTTSPILEGEIHEFWLDLYTAVWHNVGVRISLWDPRHRQKLWERDFNSRETNVLWLGLSSEIEKVVRQAMDKALAEALSEFTSSAFASGVR